MFRAKGIADPTALWPWMQLRGQYTGTDAVIASNPALPETGGKNMPFTPPRMAAASLLLQRTAGAVRSRYVAGYYSRDTNLDTTGGRGQLQCVLRGQPPTANLPYDIAIGRFIDMNKLPTRNWLPGENARLGRFGGSRLRRLPLEAAPTDPCAGVAAGHQPMTVRTATRRKRES